MSGFYPIHKSTTEKSVATVDSSQRCFLPITRENSALVDAHSAQVLAPDKKGNTRRACGSGCGLRHIPSRQHLYWWQLDTSTAGAAHETSAGFAAGDGGGPVWTKRKRRQRRQAKSVPSSVAWVLRLESPLLITLFQLWLDLCGAWSSNPRA